MASMSDFGTITATPGDPSGFNLARQAVLRGQTQGTYDLERPRIARNFNTFDMPNLIGAQAARGAYNSSSTNRKSTNLRNLAKDQLADMEFGYRNTMAALNGTALLANTGISL